MNVLVLPDHESASRVVAELVCAAVAWKPTAELSVATGTTPVRAYELMVERVRSGETSFARARFLQMVEWAGAPPDDTTACQRFLREHLLTPLAIPDERFVGWRGDASDLDGECARIRDHLATAGGIDLCVLGLGVNGHIALNEPGEHLAAAAHIAALTGSTRANARFENAEDVPEHGLTLGIGEILAAREVVLMATGASKAEGVRRLMEGDVATTFPASLLWTHHRAIAVFDRAAMALVRRKSLFGA
ncbi:MAG TPA: glucosamine-6-phosphate deaminase [Planctomycetota bacterium]|nr:glucosamine-6-phosphate deaminase [Planctomycetota bacterium]